jgi:hypothetical protein
LDYGTAAHPVESGRQRTISISQLRSTEHSSSATWGREPGREGRLSPQGARGVEGDRETNPPAPGRLCDSRFEREEVRVPGV